MGRRRLGTSILLVVAGTLIISACGSAAPDEAERATTSTRRESPASSTTTTAPYEPVTEDPASTVAPTAYHDAWVERLQVDRRPPLPFAGLEDCAATAAAAGIDVDRLAAADLSPADIAGDATLDDIDPTLAEVRAFARELEGCDLAAGYTASMRSVYPAFVSEPDATCVGEAIASDDTYSLALAAWIYGHDDGEWTDATGEVFNRAVYHCPSAYGTITTGSIILIYGELPPAGASCLAEQLAGEVDVLIDPSGNDAMLFRVIRACIEPLGEDGEIMLQDLQNALAADGLEEVNGEVRPK